MLTGEAEILSQPKIPDLKIDTLSYSLTAKENPKDKIQVEIGDSKDLAQFQPQLKVMRWDNEVNFSARLVSSEAVDEIITQEDEKIIWEKGNISANFYDLPISTDNPEGGMEFEVILKELPKTNVVEFSLNTKGLEFYYQPELTEEEVKQGASRPDNVVGSYAVYASENKINYVGGKEYKCGKVGHIYRPRIEDAKGNWVWGELNIDTTNGILSVTIPQNFLDKAVYPVRHAAGLTFGYTGNGGTANYAGNYLYGYKATGSAGTLDSISAYFSIAGTDLGHIHSKAALYLTSNDNLVSATVSGELTHNSIAAVTWYTHTVTGSPEVSAVSYWITGWFLEITSPPEDTMSAYLYSDTGSAGDSAYRNFTYTGTFPNPYGKSGTSNKKFSIYATYTASSSSAIKTVNALAKASVKTINGLAIASVKTWEGLA